MGDGRVAPRTRVHADVATGALLGAAALPVRRPRSNNNNNQADRHGRPMVHCIRMGTRNEDSRTVSTVRRPDHLGTHCGCGSDRADADADSVTDEEVEEIERDLYLDRCAEDIQTDGTSVRE